MLPFFYICIFLFLLTGCDTLYRLLDKEGAQEKALVGEVVPFEKNPTVEDIQALLKLYGYSPGAVDGILGLRTRDAIARFQRENGLNQTRFVDQDTWQALNIPREYQLVVGQQLNVKTIQQILEKTTCHPGEIDGKMGPQTIKAVKCFQKKYGLKVDGKVGYQTLSRLIYFLSKENLSTQ